VNPIPYIDIHTHHSRQDDDTVTVQNIFPGGSIPSFNGRNFFSIGLHPWEIKSEAENNEQLVMMEDALEFDHVIFLGECGLDKRADTDFDEQLRVFRAQVFMAEEFQKPLIIHCVKAYNEIIEIHKSEHPSVPWILHGYSANLELTKQLVERNMFFSFGKILFNDNANALDSFRFLPIEKIFLETDEFEGEIDEIFRRGAQLRNLPPDYLKEAVWENFNRIENVSFKV
jgi:TatD DNase family protein